MATMVRKQLYITEAQNAALKRRARKLGVSEAELARQALGGMLQGALKGEAREEPRAATEVSRQRALGELIEETRRLARGRRLSEEFREAYRERGRAVLYEGRLR